MADVTSKRSKKPTRSRRPTLFVYFDPPIPEMLAAVLEARQKAEPDRRVTQSEVVRGLIRAAFESLPKKTKARS